MNLHARLCMLLCAVLIAVVAGCGGTNRPSAARPPAPTSATRLRPPIPAGAAYRRSVEVGIAARLHTTDANLRSQLRAAPGSTLEILAKPLGLAEDQLGTVTRASLDRAADAAVRSRRWTPAEARKEKRYWSTQSAPSLIAEVSTWLAGS